MNKEIVKRLEDSLDYEFDLSFSDRKELLSYIEQLENNRDKAIEKLVIKQLRYLNEPKYKLTTLDLEEIKNILKGDSDDTR